MSSTRNTPSTSSNFESLLTAALAKYTKQTGKDLINHPLASRIDNCDSPDSFLVIFQEQAQEFSEFKNGDHKLIKWLQPIVNGLHTLSTIPYFSTGASLTAKSVRASYDSLVDVFECIENFLRRLMIYTEIPPTPAMSEIVIKVMAELISVLALATKQISQGQFRKYAKKLLGERHIELVLQRLDRLNLEESLTTVAQTLDIVYGLVNNMQVVMEVRNTNLVDGKASTDAIQQTLILMQDITVNVNKIERS
ncbi:hypothetical protein BJV74DRAFT_800005 [Russula compacta]|nr:hypothetical protein BJV74DRAFT_800005 [Russula compacta]